MKILLSLLICIPLYSLPLTEVKNLLNSFIEEEYDITLGHGGKKDTSILTDVIESNNNTALRDAALLVGCGHDYDYNLRNIAEMVDEYIETVTSPMYDRDKIANVVEILIYYSTMQLPSALPKDCNYLIKQSNNDSYDIYLNYFIILVQLVIGEKLGTNSI